MQQESCILEVMAIQRGAVSDESKIEVIGVGIKAVNKCILVSILF